MTKLIEFNPKSDWNITDKSTVIIGKFMCLHRGHQKLFDEFDDKNKKIIITFSGFETFKKIKNVNRREHIYSYFKKLNVDYIINIDINKYWNIEANDFLDIISKKINIRKLVVGKNFRFGKKAAGNISMMQDRFSDLIVVPLHKENNAIVSTALIKMLIQEGSIEKANELLLIPFCYWGKTVRGEGFGKELNTKTINTRISNDLTEIMDGVYYSNLIYNSKRYFSITSIGTKPTIKNSGEKIYETHVFNFNREIYGEETEVELIKYSRPQKKFNSISELKTAIGKDKSKAVEYFLNSK